MTIRVSATRLEEVVRLVGDDAQATLGRRFDAEVRGIAENIADIFRENAHLEDVGDEVDTHWDVEYFTLRVAEETQQYFHDVFIDTTWPRCPNHSNHPLWLVDGTWTCDRDDVGYARLGELDRVAG